MTGEFKKIKNFQWPLLKTNISTPYDMKPQSGEAQNDGIC